MDRDAGAFKDALIGAVAGVLFVSTLGALAQGCFGVRPASGYTTNGGMTDSAERMAKALERIADQLERQHKTP